MRGYASSCAGGTLRPAGCLLGALSFPQPGLGSLANGEIVGPPQEGDRSLRVFWLPDIEADPSAFRQDVMGNGFSRRHDLVPHLCGKRDIDQPIAVHVADFAVPQAILRPAEPVWMRRDPFPSRNGC